MDNGYYNGCSVYYSGYIIRIISVILYRTDYYTVTDNYTDRYVTVNGSYI